MVALNKHFAPENPHTVEVNRVGIFFGESTKSSRANPLSAEEPRLKKAYGYDETASGMFFYGYRYYDPETGRWSNRDPIQEQGGLNLYAMVQNNPIGYWDYLGMQSGRQHSSRKRPYARKSRSEHYNRNEHQIDKLHNKPKDAREADWNGGVPADYHQQGQGGAGNQKYVSPDGHYEAVYDKNDNLVTDPVNRGTYNFHDPVDDTWGHVINDVVPYIRYGNSPDDPTTMWERIWASYDGPIPPNDDEGNGGGGSDSSGGGGGSPPRDKGDHDGDGVPNYKDDDFNPFEPENTTTCQ